MPTKSKKKRGMSITAMSELYFKWLINHIDYDNEDDELFIYDLFLCEFRWIHPNDVNRKMDAFELRRDFSIDEGLYYSEYETFKSVKPNCLEVLIALAQRISDDILDECESGYGTDGWFWELVKIFGLRHTRLPKTFKYFELTKEFQKGNISSKKVTKRYQKGNKKVTDLEIWYQIADYISNFYDMEDDYID